MSLVYQVFQLFWRSKPGRGSKETGDMVTETSVIGVFRNRHKLYCIVTCRLDTREYFITEFIVSVNSGLFSGHPDMRLINKRDLMHRHKMMPEMKGFFWLPHLGIENICFLILYHAPGPCRNPFALSSLPVKRQGVQITMVDGGERNFKFPRTI